ncbi:MAG: hemerythrin domain-containing protein [Bacteroidia bacterium]|jgi:regulator of cell morphogenesis and NO signaling|nr:hemerythrin domain-containing protein [Bacteroidia bacterium]
MIEKSLFELLEQNHSYASILHWCGIDAFDYLDETLEDVCKIKNINTRVVAQALVKSSENSGYSYAQLNRLSPSELCNYLQHTHHHYSQRMLPVIEHHIQQTGLLQHQQYPQLLLLIKIFETFKADFLTHIAYENRVVFPYIKKLEKHTVNFKNSLWIDLKDFSIADFILKHHSDDDDMHNIRTLLNNYEVHASDKLAYKVLMHELKSFESDLKAHSLIEEDLLIPRAIKLEERLTQRAKDLIRLN